MFREVTRRLAGPLGSGVRLGFFRAAGPDGSRAYYEVPGPGRGGGLGGDGLLNAEGTGHVL